MPKSQPDALGSDGQRTLVHQEAQSSDHAAALAQAELDRRVAYEVTLRGTAEGDAALRPGSMVEISRRSTLVRGTLCFHHSEPHD